MKPSPMSIARYLYAMVIYAGVIAAIAWSMPAHAQTGIATTAPDSARVLPNIKPLIPEALQAGSAAGWISGPVAESFYRQLLPNQTHDGQRVLLVMERLKVFNESCGRFRLVLSKPGQQMANRSGQALPAQFAFEMNLCADGSPPQEGIDLSRIAPGNSTAVPAR